MTFLTASFTSGSCLQTNVKKIPDAWYERKQDYNTDTHFQKVYFKVQRHDTHEQRRLENDRLNYNAWQKEHRGENAVQTLDQNSCISRLGSITSVAVASFIFALQVYMYSTFDMLALNL